MFNAPHHPQDASLPTPTVTYAQMKPFYSITEHHQDLLAALQHVALLPLQTDCHENAQATHLGLEGSIKLLQFQEALLKVTQHRLMTHLQLCTQQRAWDLALELLDTLQNTLEKKHAWQNELTVLKAEVLYRYAEESPWGVSEEEVLSSEDCYRFRQSAKTMLETFTQQWKEHQGKLLSTQAPVSIENLKHLMVYTKALVLLGTDMTYPLNPVFKQDILNACEGLVTYQYPNTQALCVASHESINSEEDTLSHRARVALREGHTLDAICNENRQSVTTLTAVNTRLAELVKLLAKDDLSRGSLSQGLEGYRHAETLLG